MSKLYQDIQNLEGRRNTNGQEEAVSGMQLGGKSTFDSPSGVKLNTHATKSLRQRSLYRTQTLSTLISHISPDIYIVCTNYRTHLQSTSEVWLSVWKPDDCRSRITLLLLVNIRPRPHDLRYVLAQWRPQRLKAIDDTLPVPLLSS